MTPTFTGRLGTGGDLAGSYSSPFGWHYMYGTLKTTVYLNDEEVQALRQLAAATGRSQADLIREAIRHAAAQAPSRRFRSLG